MESRRYWLSMKKDFTFTASDAEKISVTTYGDLPKESARCIIYAHGFKGFKDWGFVPYLGEFLASKGFFVVTFNFSHNGIGDNPTEFTRLDKFAENTLSREVRELTEMIGAVRGGVFGPTRDAKIGILGHSRGGGVALAAAGRRTDLDAVAVWSSVSHFDRYSEEAKKEWREKGYSEVVNARTGQVMKMKVEFLDDIEQNRDDYLSIEKAVREMDVPLLIVHGEEDESVPASEAREIYSWADDSGSRLLVVPAAGHTFNAKHPFDGSNEKLDDVLNQTADFFDEYL